MKKFLPALFAFLIFSLLPFRSFSAGGPALAAEDCSLFDSITGKNPAGDFICDAQECLGGMDAPTCTSIVNLFSSKPADGPWYNQNPTQFAKKIKDAPADEIFGERYTFAQINWIINSLATMLNPASGIDSPTKLFQFINAVKGVISQVQNGQQPSLADYAKLGPAGLFAGGVSALYTNPPASSVGEVKYMAGKLFDYTTGTQLASAQGYGFTGLGGQADAKSAVKALWTASRNMAYLIMVILLVASGFLIMFRVKINPQTVVSLQTMIPKLIITMLLVTFSFAIAGLVIDLIYVVIAAFVGFFSLGGIIDQPTQVGDIIGRLTGSNFGQYLLIQFNVIIIAIIVGVIGGFIAFSTFALIPGLNAFAPIIGVIAATGVFIWVLLVLIKIYIMLVKTYVLMILQISIAPLQIMLDLIPGQQGFSVWIRNLIANASVFVVVPVMLLVQYTLSWSFWANNLLNLRNFQDLGGVDLGLPFLGSGIGQWNILTQFLVGTFILSLTPKIADIIRDMLKIPAFKYGTALGEAIAPLRTMAGMAARERGMKYLEGKGLVEYAPGVGYKATRERGSTTATKTVDMVSGFLQGKG